MGRSLIHHDDRSKNFRAISPRQAEVLEPRNRRWFRYGVYDQGQTSTCVAQTGKGILNTRPHLDNIPLRVRKNFSIDDFYLGAQQNDEWPGQDYDGTSGLGLCKYLAAAGIIKEYRWCFGLQDVLLTLSHKGPVGIGVWWYTGMFYPNSEGLIEATGSQEGGHEIELIANDVDREEVEFINSWGAGWGKKGRGRMKWTTLERLLNEQGDAFLIPDQP